MSQPLYVANSSPFIVFERVGKSSLLRDLLHQVFIPSAVRREVFGNDPLPTWILEQALEQPLASEILRAHLGSGEREAIALALEKPGAWLVVDDLAARRLAQSLGIPLIGSLGIILRAKELGKISAVKPILVAMQSDDFRIADQLYADLLKSAGEI
jgi:uncharacterized protein